MQTLHPLVSSVDLTWLRGRPVEMVSSLHTPAPAQVWLASPVSAHAATANLQVIAR